MMYSYYYLLISVDNVAAKTARPRSLAGNSIPQMIANFQVVWFLSCSCSRMDYFMMCFVVIYDIE